MRVERALEKALAIATIAALIAAGFQMQVNDGEETALDYSRDPAAILAAMFSTDEDSLIALRHHPDGVANHMESGWVRFIYGNDGFDVISDYTTNLESVLAPICGIEESSLASRLERGNFGIVFP